MRTLSLKREWSSPQATRKKNTVAIAAAFLAPSWTWVGCNKPKEGKGEKEGSDNTPIKPIVGEGKKLFSGDKAIKARNRPNEKEFTPDTWLVGTRGGRRSQTQRVSRETKKQEGGNREIEPSCFGGTHACRT